MIKEVALILTAHDFERLVETFKQSGLNFKPDVVKSFKYDAWDLVALKWNVLLTVSDEYHLIKKFVQPLVVFDFLEIDPMDMRGSLGTFGLLRKSICLP